MVCSQTNRTGRVWCGAGAVSASAMAASTSSGGTGSSLNRRTDLRNSCACWRPSSMASAVPSQNRSSSPGRSSCRAVEPSSVDGQPAHHGHRHRGQFALDQIGGRSDLVGHRDLGDHQLVAVSIDDARIAMQHSQTGRSDRRVDLAVAPGPAHGVGDNHRDVDAEPLAQPRAQRRGAAIGIDWQQGEFSPADIGSVHTGGGLNQPDPVLGDQRPAFARQHPHRLLVDQLAAQRVPLLGILGRGNQPALAFGHHLAGDDHDVAVAQPRRGGGDGSDQIVAGPKFRKPGDGQDLDRCGGTVLLATRIRGRSRSRRHARELQPAVTISAVAFGSVISSGTAAHRDAVDVGMIAFVYQPAVQYPGAAARTVVPAHCLGGGFDADHREAFIGHATQRLSADYRRIADDRGRGRAQRTADPGHGKDGADADHRVGRRQQDDVGLADGRHRFGCGAAFSAPMNAKLCVGTWAR